MKNKMFLKIMNLKDDKMDLLDVMLKRRSVRKYTDEEIPNEKMNRIIQAGLLAPTSRNLKPCNFLVIEDKEVLRKIAESKEHGAAFLKDANKAIAVIGNSLVADTWIEDSSIALAFMHLMAAEQNIGSCWIQIRLRKNKEGECSRWQPQVKKRMQHREKKKERCQTLRTGPGRSGRNLVCHRMMWLKPCM